MFFDKSCTIYPYVTSIVDEQEIQSFSATASYTWKCDYWMTKSGFADATVVQQDVRGRDVCLPWIVNISALSKVVLDNGMTFKVVDIEQYYSVTWSEDNTLLSCIYTDG
jgi:hypothetical protein